VSMLQMWWRSVIASFPDLEVRRELAQNVTVVGATSGLSHFAVRLQKVCWLLVCAVVYHQLFPGTCFGLSSGLWLCIAHFGGIVLQELREMPHCHPAVVVECPPQPGNSVFLGGSVVASMPTTLFVTREEYDEFGPSLIDVCFD
jgi:actin-related protein